MDTFSGLFKLLTLLHRPKISTGLRSRSWSRSRKEAEVFGWSQGRIPNNTGSRSRIFVSDSHSECPFGSFFTSHS